MTNPISDTGKAVRSEIIKVLENSTSRSFIVQMILSTVFTYLAALTIIVFIDLILYEVTVGLTNLTGLIGYFLSSSLLMFLPIAIFSTVLVMILTRPIVIIMKRNEKGGRITEDEYHIARKRAGRIPQIIFIVNIVFPVILNIISDSFANGFSQGITNVFKDVSIFILAALCQNALYQRLLTKPRAIMKIYTIDPDSPNWFVKNMDRIQLYTSVLLIAAVFFNASMTIIQGIKTIPDTALSAESPEDAVSATNLNGNFQKMHQKMQAAGSPIMQSETGIEGSLKNRRIGFLTLFLFLSFTVMGLIIVVDALVTRAKRTQTKILRDVLSDMAEGSGNLTHRVLIVQADETGMLSNQLNRVLDKLQSMFRHIAEQTVLVAESSRAVSSVLEGTVTAAEEMTASVSQINSNISKNQEIVTTSQESLNRMLQSLDQININVNTQAAHVEQTSSAMTEMIANIQSVNEVTSKANKVSENLKIVSETGAQAVLNSISAVKDIEESSNEVNSLVQIISRILAATNMLAMNAAIEAAHAGEAGRGFAVVAEEVRNLADDSSGNLKTISENIKDVISKVNRGVNLSETAGGALNEVSKKTEQTSRLMNEVASAMQEQTAGANEVLNSIHSLVEASGAINRLSEEQHQNNEIMKDNLEKTVNAFIEVQSATAELELGNGEILSGIEELKEVISRNEKIVAALQDELGGFKI